MGRRLSLLAASAAFALVAGCSGGGGGGGDSGSSSGNTGSSSTTSSTTSSTSSTSTGGQTGSSVNVDTCFSQQVATGITVQDLLTRDTLRLDLTRPNGFPNGRQLQDPVIDLTLAYMFGDLSRVALDSLAKVAVNPPSNADTLDAGGAIVPFTTTFPFVVVAHGPPKPAGVGSNFAFRTNPVTDYDTIDAMGNPALGTILIQFNVQPAFNADSPAAYISGGGKYIAGIKTTLAGLATLLKDDFDRLSYPTCARTT